MFYVNMCFNDTFCFSVGNFLIWRLYSAGIEGGRQKDFSVGLNYYLNKHIAIKLNYSYFLPGANVKVIDKNDFSVLQGRFQFIF